MASTFNFQNPEGTIDYELTLRAGFDAEPVEGRDVVKIVPNEKVEVFLQFTNLQSSRYSVPATWIEIEDSNGNTLLQSDTGVSIDTKAITVDGKGDTSQWKLMLAGGTDSVERDVSFASGQGTLRLFRESNSGTEYRSGWDRRELFSVPVEIFELREPDFTVTSASAPSEVDVDGTINAEVTVENQGDGDGTFENSISLQNDRDLTVDSTSVSGFIPSGGSKTFTVEFPAPSTEQTLTLVVGDVTSLPGGPYNIDVIKPIEYSVTSVSATDGTPEQGQNIRLNFKVDNTGKEFTGNILIDFDGNRQFSEQQTIKQGLLQYNTRNRLGIGDNVSTGNHKISITVEAPDGSANGGSVTVDVQEGAEANIAVASLDASPNPVLVGNEVEVTTTFTNIGDASGQIGDYTLNILNSDGNTIDTISTSSTKTISPGGTASDTIRFNAPNVNELGFEIKFPNQNALGGFGTIDVQEKTVNIIPKGLTLSKDNVGIGESFDASIPVVNEGTIEGSGDITLRVSNGDTKERTITTDQIKAGASGEIKFGISVDGPGAYSISVLQTSGKIQSGATINEIDVSVGRFTKTVVVEGRDGEDGDRDEDGLPIPLIVGGVGAGALGLILLSENNNR